MGKISNARYAAQELLTITVCAIALPFLAVAAGVMWLFQCSRQRAGYYKCEHKPGQCNKAAKNG